MEEGSRVVGFASGTPTRITSLRFVSAACAGFETALENTPLCRSPIATTDLPTRVLSAIPSFLCLAFPPPVSLVCRA